jgi:hypothetical protein
VAVGAGPDPLGVHDDETAARLLHIVTPTIRTEATVREGREPGATIGVASELLSIAAAEARRCQDARSKLRHMPSVTMACSPAVLNDSLSREIAWLDAHSPLVMSRRRRGPTDLPRGLLALFRMCITDSSGQVVENRLVPVHGPLSRLGHISGLCEPLMDRARTVGAFRAELIRPSVAHRIDRFRRRERALDRYRTESGTSQLGLFDVTGRSDPDRPVVESLPRMPSPDDLVVETELVLLAHIR